MQAGQMDADDPPNQQPRLPANIFSSISCNTNRSTSVNAKPGRGRSTGSGTGSRRGNRGSQIRAVPVSGEGVTRNSYTTAYCYQSVLCPETQFKPTRGIILMHNLIMQVVANCIVLLIKICSTTS